MKRNSGFIRTGIVIKYDKPSGRAQVRSVVREANVLRYYLNREGEWVHVGEGERIPEDCHHPVEVFDQAGAETEWERAWNEFKRGEIA